MAGVSDIARLTGLTQQNIYDVFDAILNLTRTGEKVTIRNFGSFIERTQQPRTVISSAIEGGTAEVPEAQVLRFKASKATRRFIKARAKAVDVEPQTKTVQRTLPVKLQEKNEAVKAANLKGRATARPETEDDQ